MTTLPDLPESVEATIDIIRSDPAVRRIVLFGSRAVGDHDERSDVDLAISAPDMTRGDFAVLLDRVSEALTLYKVELSWLEAMPEELRARVLAQEVVLS